MCPPWPRIHSVATTAFAWISFCKCLKGELRAGRWRVGASVLAVLVLPLGEGTVPRIRPVSPWLLG